MCIHFLQLDFILLQVPIREIFCLGVASYLEAT